MTKGSWKIWFVLGTLSLVIMFAGHYFGGRQGLLWTFVFSIFINALFYFFGDIRLADLFEGRQIEGQDPWNLIKMAKELCQKARVPLPEIYVVSLQTPTAFSIGRNWKNSKIYITSSLIDELDPEDLRAVLAYEITKIKRQDTLTLTMSSAIAGGIFIFKSMYKSSSQRTIQDKSFTYYLRAIWAPIMSLMVRSVFNPKRTFETDKMAAELLGDPKALAKVLWKLEAFCNTRPLHIPISMAHLFIVNPMTGRDWFKHFLIQPKVENRILQLVGSYPI